MSAYAVVFGATLIWLAAVISPGPNFLVVSRLALSRSRASAIGATLGIAAGSVIYAALTLFGLSVAHPSLRLARRHDPHRGRRLPGLARHSGMAGHAR